MSRENLKVNYKTVIEEFKRKHNYLVDSSSIKIETSNISQLTDTEIDNLKVGDVVRKKTGNQEHCYIVTYKEEKHGICLSYFDCGYLETISYDYNDGHWVFNSKDIINVPDDRNVVHKIPAPLSTTLTDEQIAVITEGVFIDGTFLSKKGLVLFPTEESENYYTGMFISSYEVGIYHIVKATKLIEIVSATALNVNLRSVGYFNGKVVPAYPSSTGTFTLKMVNGVLTWVEEI